MPADLLARLPDLLPAALPVLAATNLAWGGFLLLVFAMLALDLGVFHRKAHVVGTKEALGWSIVWVSLALLFGAGVWIVMGSERALEYLSAYVVEKTLSVDNVFIFAIIFSSLAIPAIYQHRVLFWGILGALVMRGAMIALGTKLIQDFSWMTYVLGGFLILTALKMLLTGDNELDPEKGYTVRIARRLFRMAPDFDGERFFTRINGSLAATPLFLVLLVVETTDVVFAVDSIPAIFSITKDPFLVFTSNVFAILGLRSLYFALAAFMGKFRYLKISLVFVLAFVGVKMLLANVQHIRTEVSLAIIVTILGIGIGASLLASRREQRRAAIGRPAPVTDLAEAAEEAWRRSRRYIIFVVGITIVGCGLAVGTIPGPGGIPIVLAGLALLATEFVWAKRLLTYTRQKAETTLQNQGPWLTVFGVITILVGIGLIAFHHRFWGIPVVVSGAFVVLTELVYNRFLRRRREAAAGSIAVPPPVDEVQPKETAA